ARHDIDRAPDGFRPLVVVLVAGEHDVDAVTREGGPERPAHGPRRSVPAGRVRRMVEGHDSEGGVATSERPIDPGPLFAVSGARGIERQQLDGAEPALVPARRHPETAGDL